MNTEQLTDRLVQWIRDRVHAAGSQGTVIGMSGGIDSSLASVLCQRAFPDNVLGVLLPCHSSPRDEEHARAVAERFAIPTRQVVLDGVYDMLSDLLPHDEPPSETGLMAFSNLKARLRMLTLYHFANRLGYLVVGSSNRSELAVGYFTKYGDGGVDICPLGNLIKMQVREMASFLGIPREIIGKPPSAGLWPGQTDEAELGLTYEQIDRYLLRGEAEDEVRQKIESMLASGRHKRQPPLLPDF